MLTRQSRSHRMEGGMASVQAIWRERQKSWGSLQVYCGPTPVRGASGSAGGQQSPSSSPHEASSSAAQHAFSHSATELHNAGIGCKWACVAVWFVRGSAPGGGVLFSGLGITESRRRRTGLVACASGGPASSRHARIASIMAAHYLLYTAIAISTQGPATYACAWVVDHLYGTCACAQEGS